MAHSRAHQSRLAPGTRHERDRNQAVQWARQLLSSQEFVMFDSETTGLGSPCDFVEVAVCGADGEVLLQSLVKPCVPIEPSARRVHGYSASSLENAPSFTEIYPYLLEVLWAKRVVVYNAAYDRRVWDEAVSRLGARASLAGKLPEWECAMRRYAAWVGETSKRYGGYRYQKLPGGDHSASGDCLATLRLIEQMAGYSPGVAGEAQRGL